MDSCKSSKHVNKSIFLSRCMKLTVQTIENLALCCNKTKHLKLKWFPHFDDSAIEFLHKISLLDTLALKFIHGVTNGIFSTFYHSLFKNTLYPLYLIALPYKYWKLQAVTTFTLIPYPENVEVTEGSCVL
jgi:hypothetical protein